VLRGGNGSNVETRSDSWATPSEEGQTHSFIVKIWLNQNFKETGQARWSAHITHVPGGERQYFSDLSEIAAFIRPFLGAMNVHSRLRWRLWKWLFHPSK
jgi:hypothetical protein